MPSPTRPSLSEQPASSKFIEQEEEDEEERTQNPETNTDEEKKSIQRAEKAITTALII